MPNFIQLPQAGSALPILINVSTIQQARLEDNRITVLVQQEEQTVTYTSRPLPSSQAVALYWYLHAMLTPAPLELCPN